MIDASNKGHTEIAKLLLAVPGIDVDIVDRHGYTALTMASMRGHTDIVKLIKNHKKNQKKRRVRGVARTIPKMKQAQVRAAERVYKPGGLEYKKLHDKYYRDAKKQN